MYLELDFFSRGGGEPPKRPRKDFIASSKGYPEIRDPAVDNPVGILPPSSEIGAGYERRLRNKYGAKLM